MIKLSVYTTADISVDSKIVSTTNFYSNQNHVAQNIGSEKDNLGESYVHTLQSFTIH